ncbi:MAG: ABC transporter substrate-binding protein [Candidatus Komeilibacteria bacterium]|nr:ABC transporter substrate-binding protein [Candidatus Komeilibacteria bacterium]
MAKKYYGQEIQKVTDYYLSEINQRAAALGKKFEVIYEDGKCTGNDSVSAFHKLVDVDGIKFILGGSCSSETLGIAPLTKDSNKVLVISALSSNPVINGLSPFTYSFSYSDDTSGKIIAKQMSAYKKVAIISEQNDFNIGIKKVWEDALKQYPGAQVVANEIFPKGASDFRVILEKVKKAQPEAIFLNPNPGVTAQNLIKQLAEIKDWTNYKLYSHYSYLAEDTLKVAPTVVEGMIIIDAPKLTDPGFLSLKQQIEATKGTVADLGDYYTASTMDVMNVVTSLITELGENPQAVRDALATRTFQGYIGSIHFGNNNFPDIAAAVYKVINGKPELQP